MTHATLPWFSVRPLLQTGWSGRADACAALWMPPVQGVLRAAAGGVWKSCRGLLPCADLDELVHAVMLRLLGRAVRKNGLTAPASMGEGGAGGWLYRVVHNAAIDEVDALVRAAGGVGRSARTALNRVCRAVGRLRNAIGRLPEHAEVAAELEMPLDAYWTMLHRHGIQLDGWHTASIVVPANGSFDFEELAEDAEQEDAVIAADSARVVDAAVRSGRMRPCHRLAWICLEQPWALDDATIDQAADGLARSPEETSALLDRWLSLSHRGDDDRSARLSLAWILRCDAPLVDDDLLASALAWKAVDPDGADRARDLVRVWVRRARTVVARGV